MRHDFFDIISRDAFQKLLLEFPCSGTESVSIEEACGRFAAVDILSPEDLPPVNRSCMDGFAVNAADVFGSGESEPSYLECVAELGVDQYPDFEISPGECARIATGGTLPEGSDAVVMVEHTGIMGADTVEIRKSAAPGENVMLKGEDCAKGKAVLKEGQKIRFQDVGLLAALGISEIKVHKKPSVGILSTGDELTDIKSGSIPGKMRDVNSYTLRCLVEKAGGIPQNYGIIGDNLEALKSALKKALAENDLVLLSGGSSVGVRDFTVQAIEEMKDSAILAHGVAISPGKPTILGKSEGKPILGLPGQVTSVQIIMLVLVIPFIKHISGSKNPFKGRVLIPAELARNTASKQGREDYVRVKLEKRENNLPLAHPLIGKSGLLRTMTEAEGLMVIAEDTEGSYAGKQVEIWLL
ncbi:gephyrin-like molybdotransferase Glp [Maridesulfovibrio bastinii]|uniref:molybdopterin molybdotransferase MoeA n=1 Tax=Maridesulfovibrio bastinii TaxID=47157 RepID=UPI0004060122|nr:gephyrin-like molybdotransferase Glp [Maridesulfovibrio bastinii]